MRTASSLAILLALTLSLFSSVTASAHISSPARPLTPAEQAAPPAGFPAEADAPAAGAPQLPAAAQDALAPRAAGDERWDDRFQLPGIDSSVELAAAAPDGLLYVVADGEVFRWDGRTWASLGDSSFEVRGLAVFRGELYAAGDFTSIGASNVRDLARWDGTRWRQVGTGVGPQRDGGFGNPPDETSLHSLAVMGDTLYVGGDFNLIDGVSANNIAAWDGEGFSALGQGVQAADWQGEISEFNSAIVSVIEPAGGKLYVGGQFGYAGSTRSGSLGVWDGDSWAGVGGGLLDDTFTSEPETAVVHAIAVNGADVYVGGQFTLAGAGAAQRRVKNIAHWSGSAWSDFDGGTSSEFSSIAKVYALRYEAGKLYVGGEFDGIGGETIPALATWDGAAWQGLGGLDTFSTVHTIVRVPTGGLYIGGDFEMIGGVSAISIVRLNGTSWKALGEGLSLSETSNCCEGQVRALAADAAGRIYAGGRFVAAGGVIVNNVAMWDGARWHALGAGVEGGDVEALAVAGDTLYVGGSFTSAGGQSIANIARYTFSTKSWSALGGGVNGTVYALDYADGTLFVGGDFDRAGSLDVYDVAFWDGAWGAPDDSTRIYQVFDTCNEAGSQAYAITVSGRYMVVGGNFELVLVNPANPCSLSSYRQANNLLLYDLVDGVWFLVGSDGQYGAGGGPALYPGVEALEVVGPALDAGGTLYVGGDFAQAGDVNAQNLARWSLDDNWSTPGGTSGDSGGAIPERGVYALEQAGGSLYVGGNFTSAGTATANAVARYDLAAGSWSALGSGTADHYTVYALAAAPDALFLGGKFEQVGGKAAAGIAAWLPAPAGITVGPEGGNVSAGGAAVTFPAGAVPAATDVRIAELFAAPGQPPAGQAFAAGLRVGASRGGQAVTSFSQPYTLRFSYTPALLSAAGIGNASSLKIARRDGQSLVVISGAQVDTSARTVTVTVSQTGDFALIGAAGSGGQTPGSNRIFLPMLTR